MSETCLELAWQKEKFCGSGVSWTSRKMGPSELSLGVLPLPLSTRDVILLDKFAGASATDGTTEKDLFPQYQSENIQRQTCAHASSLGVGYHLCWPHENPGLGGDGEGEFVRRERVHFSEVGGKTPGR